MKFDKKRRDTLKGIAIALMGSTISMDLHAKSHVDSSKVLILTDGKNQGFLEGLREAKVDQQTIKVIDLVGNFSKSKKQIENELKKAEIKSIVGMMDNANFVILEQILKEQKSQIAMEISHTTGQKLQHFIASSDLPKEYLDTTKDLLKDKNWSFMIGFILGHGIFDANFVNFAKPPKTEIISTNVQENATLVSFVAIKKEVKNV